MCPGAPGLGIWRDRFPLSSIPPELEWLQGAHRPSWPTDFNRSAGRSYQHTQSATTRFSPCHEQPHTHTHTHTHTRIHTLAYTHTHTHTTPNEPRLRMCAGIHVSIRTHPVNAYDVAEPDRIPSAVAPCANADVAPEWYCQQIHWSHSLILSHCGWQ